MAENIEKLRATLAQLHGELAAAHNLDVESLAMMRQVMADMEETIARGEASGRPLDTQAVHHRSIIRRLGDAARGFELTHPMLSGAIGSVIDALGRMGI